MKLKFLTPILATLLSAQFIHANLVTPYDLKELVDYALENNLAILRAKEQIEEQEGLIIEIKSAVLPNAEIRGDFTDRTSGLFDTQPNVGTGGRTTWGVSIEVNQLVYSGGGVRASLKAQKFARESVAYALQSIADQAVFEVKVRYYDALLAKEQILVEEQNVELLEEQLSDVRDRFEAQTISRFELLQAEVELANAQPALIQARNNYRIAVDELMLSVGYQSSRQYAYDGSEVIGNLQTFPVSYNFTTGLKTALENRPELLELNSIIDAREAGVRVARAGYLPTVSVFGAYDIDKNPTSGDPVDALSGWRVGVRSSWAIFDGRATKGRVIQARSQLRQTELSKQELELRIEVDVRRAVSALQEAEELTSSVGKVMEQAEEALRLAELRFEAGTATQLEVISSQTALTAARTNFLSANYAHLVAKAQYDRAIGITNF